MQAREDAILSDTAKRLLPWLVAVGFFMESLDTTILNTAVPAIAAALKVPPLSMKAVLASYTLSLAVTGKMIGGREVNRQTITREEALIAHTRSNARFLFQEGDLGSLARGKYADLLVLDRDYLTVPADEIKDIKPLMTMVGGKVVYDSTAK